LRDGSGQTGIKQASDSQVRKIQNQLQYQVGLLNCFVILNKLRILPRRLNEKLCLNSTCFWLVGLAGLADLVPKSVASIVISVCAQTHKIRQLQNQIGLLNRLIRLILNKLRICSQDFWMSIPSKFCAFWLAGVATNNSKCRNHRKL